MNVFFFTKNLDADTLQYDYIKNQGELISSVINNLVILTENKGLIKVPKENVFKSERERDINLKKVSPYS